MQFKTANAIHLTLKIKRSAGSSTNNACKDLEKEIHSLCWYNEWYINQIFSSMGTGHLSLSSFSGNQLFNSCFYELFIFS